MQAAVVQPAVHPAQALDEHRHEHRVDADERAPEVNLAEHVVHLPACRLREPVIDAGKEREDRPRRHDVVEVGDDVIGVVQVDVRRRSPSGSPVSPPMPNIGRNASAKSIGVVKRIDAPQSDRSSAVRMTTDGIEMIIVVVWKNALIVVPMPVMNMWCAQTMNDMKPRKITEYTSAR